MHIHNDPEVFVEAQPLLTVGASPLTTSLFSLNKHFPQLVCDTTAIAFDGVVSDLHRILAMIKFHRGTLAPIHALSDDVLTRIFRFLHSYSGRGGDLAWSKIMLVCRRWHSLIMSDGYLWSFVDPSNLARWTLDWHSQIERAGNWPLSISHKGRSDDDDAYTYELLAPTVPNRVHTLRLLHCSESLILGILRALNAAGLSELVTLEISTSRTGNDSEPFILPPDILSLPKIASLILTDLIIDTRLIPSQMTRLDLCVRTSSVYYDLRHILDALSTLPNLQILNLERSVRDILHRSPYPKVHLPVLRILSISGFQDVIVHFLQSLVVPHTTSVFLSTRPVIKDVTAVSRNIIAPLRKFFRHPQGTRLRAVKIQSLLGDVSSDFDTTIIGFDHKDVKSVDYMSMFDERKSMSLEFFFESAKRQKRLVRKVFTSLMSQTELLDINSMSRGSLSPSCCKMALLSLPALTEVHLTASTSTCLVFCQCLQKLMGTHPKDYPRLRGIYVSMMSEERVTSVERQRYMYRRDSDEAPPYMEITDIALHRRNCEALRDLLRSYEEGGHRLDWFAISNEDFWYWPGVEETREMARRVGRFMYYNGDKVYHSEDKPTITAPTIPPRNETLFDGFSEYY